MALNPAGGGGNGDPPPELLPGRWISCALDLNRLPPEGSKVWYFPQGHFEQWAGHLAPPLDGHAPLILCTVTSLRIFTAAHAPYAVVSLTPAAPDVADAPAVHVLPNPRPATSFEYNFKEIRYSEIRVPSLPLPKAIHESVLPQHGAEQMSQQLTMLDIRGQLWTFTHSKTPKAAHSLREWRDYAGVKVPGQDDKVYFLRREEDRQLFIELRKCPSTEEAAAQRQAAPPLDLNGEIQQAADLSSQGREFTATYYPHKGLGKFFVPQRDYEEAMEIQWEPGMKVRLRKDVLRHTTLPLYSTQQVTGVVKVVKDFTWRSLEVVWDGSTTSEAEAVSAWEVEVVGSLPRKRRMVDVGGPSKAVCVNPPSLDLELSLRPTSLPPPLQ